MYAMNRLEFHRQMATALADVLEAVIRQILE
jgi:hypothetical protein